MSEQIFRRPPADGPIQDDPICYRLEPEKRLVPLFDSSCIAEFPVAKPGKMGFRVVDNCCEDNIQ